MQQRLPLLAGCLHQGRPPPQDLPDLVLGRQASRQPGPPQDPDLGWRDGLAHQGPQLQGFLRDDSRSAELLQQCRLLALAPDRRQRLLVHSL